MKRLLCTVALLSAIGCVNPLYDWGSYSESLDHLYAQGDNLQLTAERDRLAKEIEVTSADHKLVPPGKYAQVGYLCYLVGDAPGARKYFQAEKMAYPESAIFVDRLLGNLQ